MQAARAAVFADLQHRAQLLSEHRLLPSLFGRAMRRTTKHFAQDFAGGADARDSLVITPPGVRVSSVFDAITQPTERDMALYILEGERMVWRAAKAHC